MKILSIEQKAKAYDEAIEIARAKYAMKDQPTHQDLADIFPELAVSEDERIRKEMIEIIKNEAHEFPASVIAEKSKSWIAWLEKQGDKDKLIKELGEYKVKYTQEVLSQQLEKKGEQKPAVIIPKFRVGDTIRIKNSDAEYTITEISDGYYRGKGWCLDIAAGDECSDYELVEQKPAEWNEEDEEYIKSSLDIINGTPSLTPSEVECHKDWLKSLRPQNTWKPSATDIKVLEEVIDSRVKPLNYHATLHGILEQLKKLRGE